MKYPEMYAEPRAVGEPCSQDANSLALLGFLFHFAILTLMVP